MDDSAIITGFRGASAIAYLLDVICSIVFMASGGYLGVIIALYTITIAMFVFVSVIQQPSSMVEKMNNHTEFIFTFKGRFIVDVFLALFLFGMGGFGVAMGIITLVRQIDLGSNQRLPSHCPLRYDLFDKKLNR